MRHSRFPDCRGRVAPAAPGLGVPGISKTPTRSFRLGGERFCGRGARRNEEMPMKSSILLFALVAAAGALAAAPPDCGAQTSGSGARPAALPASGASQTAQEATLIQAALNHFDSALALHDFGQLQALGIRPASAKGWQKFFRNNPRATVTDDCPASTLAILGDTATWSCTETATLISEGKPLPYSLAVRFTFTRQNGVWTISDRR